MIWASARNNNPIAKLRDIDINSLISNLWFELIVDCEPKQNSRVFYSDELPGSMTFSNCRGYIIVDEIISIKNVMMFQLDWWISFSERTFTELAGIRRLRHPTAHAVGAPA